MVDNKSDLERTVERLRAHGSFGLDMEFQRERTFRPRLQLVQVSTPDESLLIDPLAFDDLDSLWSVVEDPKVRSEVLELREAKAPTKKETPAVINAVIDKDNKDHPDVKANAGAVDAVIQANGGGGGGKK